MVSKNLTRKCQKWTCFLFQHGGGPIAAAQAPVITVVPVADYIIILIMVYHKADK